MSHLFDPDNRFWRFIGKIFDAMFMGLLWLLFSLPVFTVGASTTAIYQYTLRQVNDTEGSIWRSFTRFFKKRFKKATIIWLIQLAAGAFLAYDLWACWKMIDWGGGISPLKLCFLGLVSITLVYLSMFLYVYPILSLFDLEIKKIISNAFIMSMGNLPVTVTVALLFVLAGVGTYYYPLCFPFLFGLAVFFSSYFIYHVLDRYAVDEEEEKPSDERTDQTPGE